MFGNTELNDWFMARILKLKPSNLIVNFGTFGTINFSRLIWIYNVCICVSVRQLFSFENLSDVIKLSRPINWLESESFHIHFEVTLEFFSQITIYYL